MSVISLLNEQLKNNLNKTTRELLFSISDKFNLPYESLLNTWNKINPEFNCNFTKIVIEDDMKPVIEDVIVKPVIEDEEIIVKSSGSKKIQIVIED
jgi:hypothetical protein